MCREPLSPNWRLWLTNWSAVRRLAEQLETTREVIAGFCSMADVGEVVVTGTVVNSRLEHWIREDSELIWLRELNGQWEIVLDVDDDEAPCISMTVAGERRVDFSSLGDGTAQWRWDFLSDQQNRAIQAIKHLALGDEAVNEEALQAWLGESGLELRKLDRNVKGTAYALTFGVGPQPNAQRCFTDMMRALIAEIPGLQVYKERM